MIIHLQRIDFYEYLFGQLFSNVYLSSHFTIDLIQSKAHMYVKLQDQCLRNIIFRQINHLPRL